MLLLDEQVLKNTHVFLEKFTILRSHFDLIRERLADLLEEDNGQFHQRKWSHGLVRSLRLVVLFYNEQKDGMWSMLSKRSTLKTE